jgi:carbamoyl-phosphate synthase large subunit
VVSKVPRFAFEKFPGTKDYLTTQMRSVGEAMGIGRTFKESLQKALLSLEENAIGAYPVVLDEALLAYPNSKRVYHVFQAFREGYSIDEVNAKTQIHPWFLEHIEELAHFERELAQNPLDRDLLLEAKKKGFSDAAIAKVTGKTAAAIRDQRWLEKIVPAFLQVDTCAGEFKSETPYFYSTYHSEAQPSSFPQPMIALLGSGPNRIGQGVEFDYSCVRSVRQFQKCGNKIAMINSKPETVSTDYDTSDALFFEPLTYENVLEILRFVKPVGFVGQLGGQTPINLARKLVESGQKLLGSSLEAIDLAEDRGLFVKICQELQFQIPRSGMATASDEALKLAESIGYPII